MASDSDASHRKHRRSPSDDEAGEKSSKRRKHRHLHRRRHHHHRSSKHGDGVEESNNGGGEEIAVTPPAIPVANDDVEEGEILEEEGSGGAQTDYRIPGAHADKSSNGVVNDFRAGDKFDNDVSSALDSKSAIGIVDLDGRANGDLSIEYRKEDRRRHMESGSPLKGGHKKKSSRAVDTTGYDDRKVSNWRKSSSYESDGDEYRCMAYSPLHDRSCDEVHTRSRSMSRDQIRERSHSRGIMEEDALFRRHHERAKSDSDNERMSGRSRDMRRGSRDLAREADRERSISYNRYVGGEDRQRSRDGRERHESKEREIDREQRMEKEQERSKYMEVGRSRRREKEQVRSRDWEMDRDQRREEKERSWDRDMEGLRDFRREMERERRGDKEIDSDRRREKGRHRSRDRLVDVDRREKEQGGNRDREVSLERRRKEDRGRSRDREVEVDRKSQKEGASRNNDSIRANRRDRDRDQNRDTHRDRNRVRHHDWESERERERRNDRDRDSAREVKNDLVKTRNSNSDSVEGGKDNLKRDEDEQNDFEERIVLKLAQQEEEDLDRIKEESRKRRQAILEKYKNQQLQHHNEADSQQHNESQPGDVGKDEEPTEGPGPSVSATIVAPATLDDRIDDCDIYVAEPSFSVGKSPLQNGLKASERTSGAAGLGEGTPKSERSDEKFCDDIFGETPTGVQKLGKGDGMPVLRSGLYDNWDDADGYYSYRFGEILDDRYEITSAHGKGVFSAVVRAKDLKAGNGEPEEVAIKILRNREEMHKSGQNEVQILKKLADRDKEDKRHCVRFISSFKYRNHHCIVFESLHLNLREVLKKFGRNIGLKLTAVRAYAKQLFIALKHLKNCEVLHCDIKPDNMLVNEAKNVLKLCDFGNAMFSKGNEITPYLVSRFYRAPEIILGLPYDYSLDMWSVGCCLYELYTGKVLFPGATNNDMLRLHMELKGHFPKKMLKKGAFVDQHFDQDLNFHATVEDPVTKKTAKRTILIIKAKDIGSILKSSYGDDPKMIANFRDLLDKIFVLDPEKRLNVSQALAHPFITGK